MDVRTLELTKRAVLTGSADLELDKGRILTKDFDEVRQLFWITQMMTGNRMLEVMEKIFVELDEMAMPMSFVVSCPHGGPPTPPRADLMYLGRKLDFCDDCHDAIIAEMRHRNRELDKILRPLREMEPCT